MKDFDLTPSLNLTIAEIVKITKIRFAVGYFQVNENMFC